MKFDDINTNSVKKISNQELFNLHRRSHQLYTLAKNRKDEENKKIYKSKHNILVNEIKSRGFDHKTPLIESFTKRKSLDDDRKFSSHVVRFVVHDHKADRAGYHQDLRFELPGSKNWASFAVPRGVPLEVGIKVLAIRTHDHTSKEALFTGDIPPGEYGSGSLTIFDEGICKLEKFTSAHIIITFQGSKLKGLYHLISLGNVDVSKFKQRQYLLFKSKVKEYKPLKISPSKISKLNTVFNKYKNVRI